MSALNYNISASLIGDGFENLSSFQFYYDDCQNPDNLVENTSGTNTFSKSDIIAGQTLVIPDTAQFLYLLPLSNECPLGCNYDYKITLSGYIAPSPTPTSTPTNTPTPTPTLTLTPTPSPSNPSTILIPKPFGINTFIHISGNITVEWANSISHNTRYQQAGLLANYLANDIVSQTTNTSVPITKDLFSSFNVYESDLVTVAYDVNKLIGSKVWWYGGTPGDSGQEKTKVVITNVSVVDPQGIGPSYGPFELGYLRD